MQNSNLLPSRKPTNDGFRLDTGIWHKRRTHSGKSAAGFTVQVTASGNSSRTRTERAVDSVTVCQLLDSVHGSDFRVSGHHNGVPARGIDRIGGRRLGERHTHLPVMADTKEPTTTHTPVIILPSRARSPDLQSFGVQSTIIVTSYSLSLRV